MLIWVDTAQEMLDTTLLAYRIAEDRRVFLPIAISADGAFLTHSQTIVQVPSRAKVDRFLPRYDRGDLLLHPDNPDHGGAAGQRGLGHRDSAAEQRGDESRLHGHRRGLRRLPARLRPRAGEPVVRGVHDRGRRRHPDGHGDDFAALQGRHSQHARQGQEGRPHPAAVVPAFPHREDGRRAAGRQGYRRHRPRLLLRLALRLGRGRQRDPGGHVQCREAAAAAVFHLRPGRPRGHARGRLQGRGPLL